jgi:hypothetical protein
MDRIVIGRIFDKYENPFHHLKNGVVWDVMPCDYCRNRVSEELSASIIKVTRIG